MSDSQAGLKSGPLSLWNSYVVALTGIEVEGDLAAAYTNLMYHLDTFQFKNKMSSDARLWIVTPEMDFNEQPSSERMVEEGE